MTRKYVVFAILLLVIPLAFFVHKSLKSKRELDDRVAVYRAVDAIRSAQFRLATDDVDKSGLHDYWTADVSGLHSLGLLPREIAEADPAPIIRLIPQSRPYHGYYFVALESGQGELGSVPLKGVTRSKDGYGICAYPAEESGAEKPIYLMGPRGQYRSSGVKQRPTQWPVDSEMKNHYVIVD